MDRRALLAGVRVSVAAIVLVVIGGDVLRPATESGVRLVDTLSYFTVQSNLIGAAVLLMAAARWRREPSPLLDWLRGGSVVYLLLTMVVYNVLLADGQAMSWVNAMVHVLFPLYLAADWLVDPPGARLDPRRALLWLAYPTLYLVYTFVRGALTGWYPYPFFDLEANGPMTVAFYTAGLYAFGLFLIAAVMLIGNRLGERRVSAPAVREREAPARP
jgi:hypothetical protein